MNNDNSRQSHMTRGVRLYVLIAVPLLLQACAAATVVRKQPEFDNDDRQQLMRLLESEKNVQGIRLAAGQQR